MLQPESIDLGEDRCIARGQLRQRFRRDSLLAPFTAPEVVQRVAAGTEHVRVEPCGLAYAPGAKRLEHDQEHVLHQVLRRAAIPQVAETIGENAIRVAVAQHSLVLGGHRVIDC
jgi:hypothetical protein